MPKITEVAVVKKFIPTPKIIFDKINDDIPKNIFFIVFIYGKFEFDKSITIIQDINEKSSMKNKISTTICPSLIYCYSIYIVI